MVPGHYIKAFTQSLGLKLSRFWISTFLGKHRPNEFYKSLSPIDDADSDNQYFNALKWALENRKKQSIKNIALTGPYGSGKSSILKTFQNKYRGKPFKYLNISLATFKEEKTTENSNQSTELLRLIEISILQQIFYHEKDHNTPDSRFKKIKSLSRWQRILYAVAVFWFVAALLHYIYPPFFNRLLKQVPPNEYTPFVEFYGVYTVLILGVFFVILNSIRTISSLTIKSLKIRDAEIGLTDVADKSVLNHHLDEILYFFEVTKYNVVIIEDLDRFQETEIFTKLREINLLLNNSKKTKHLNVVFLYAVRDEMFKDKDRTKFFDFIIPVLPVINSSNSGQVLTTKRDNSKYAISNELIENISPFIDDMRLLHNVINEFHLFKSILDPRLSEDKLLGMIIYKNIMPYDFVLLAKTEGILSQCLASRNSYVHEELQKLESSIKIANVGIENLQSLRTTEISELRKIYLLHKLEGVTFFQSFVVNGKVISFDSLIEDQNFTYVVNDQVMCQQYQPESYRVSIIPAPKKFNAIEKALGSKTYEQREREILELNRNKVEQLKLEVKTLELRKGTVRNAKLKDILKLDNSGRSFEELFKNEVIKPNDQKLIKVLLQNGYIGEDYDYYISIFHEGILTRSDNQFLICVKAQQTLPFDYPLNRIENLVKKLSQSDFENHYSLNIDLLNFILNQGEHNHALDRIYGQIKSASKISIEFMEAFTAITAHEDKFFRGLSAAWLEIWKHLKLTPHLKQDRKEYYLQSILEYSEVNHIGEIASNSTLVNDLESNSRFVSMLLDITKSKAIIKELGLKFRSLDVEQSSPELVEYVYEHRSYALNPQMIKSLLSFKGQFNQMDFDTRNFESIKQSNFSELISYVNDHINQYIENTYNKLDGNSADPEARILEILNNEGLTIENSELVIKKVGAKVTDIKSVRRELWPILIASNKVIPIWTNLKEYYSFANAELTEELIGFLSNIDNAKELSTIKMTDDDSSLCRAILSSSKISDSAFKLLCESSPWSYSDLDLSAHSRSKIESLIGHECIAPEKASYDYLKKTFKEASYHVLLLEISKAEFFNTPSDFELDPVTINKILKSTAFTMADKANVVSIAGDSLILANSQNLNAINALLKNEKTFPITPVLLNRLITHIDISVNDRLEVFIRHGGQITDSNQIKAFLSTLGEPYSRLSDDATEIVVPFSGINEGLLKVLKVKGFIGGFKLRKESFIVRKEIS